MTSKICRKCKAEKDIGQFGKDVHQKDGMTVWCKACRRPSIRKWALQNKERQRELQRNWAARNAEYVREYFANWHQENKEERRAKLKEARDRNRPLYNALAASRRAAKKRASPRWADKSAILNVYVLAQLKTAETGEEHVVDHIVPLQNPSVCGLHVEANLRVIPAIENSKKSNRLLRSCCELP